MRRCFLLICIFCIGLLGNLRAQSRHYSDVEKARETLEHPANFKVVYAKDQTAIELQFDALDTNPELSKKFREFRVVLSSLYIGPNIEPQAFAHKFCVHTQSKTFAFVHSRKLSILLNAKSIDYPDAQRSTEFRSKKAFENLCWNLDRKTLNSMASSNSLSFGIGDNEFSMSADSIKELNSYLKLIDFEV